MYNTVYMLLVAYLDSGTTNNIHQKNRITMDKIQELHYDAWLSTSGIHKTVEKHAAITEDMMGRFVEWVDVNATRHRNGGWYLYDDYKVNGRPTETYTTSELIQLFKDQL